MVGWHHCLNGHEFEQIPGDGEGQGSLVCCNPWGHKEVDMTEWLNNSDNIIYRRDNPLQYSCLENSMDRGATVHGMDHKQLDITGGLSTHVHTHKHTHTHTHIYVYIYGCSP